MEKDQEFSKLKIVKKTYVFDVRKKYSNVKNFIVKKQAEIPAEIIIQKIKDFFKKKEKQEPQKKEEPPPSKKQQPSFKSSIFFSIVVVFLLFIFGSLIFLFLYLSTPSSPNKETLVPKDFSGQYSFSLKDKGIATFPIGEPPAKTAYFLLEYQSVNLSNLSFNIRIYNQKPTTQVFLLDYAREGADNYPIFRKKLFEYLEKRDINIQEITISKLLSIPTGATIIVPTGYFPKELYEQESKFNFKKILERGNNIVYIGFQIDRVLDQTGRTAPVSIGDIDFSKSKLQTTEGFRLFDAQYVATGKNDLYSESPIYGSVSVIKTKKGNGALILIPQTLDGGWRGSENLLAGEVAALDIVRLIEEQKWLQPISVVSFSTNRNNETVFFYSPPFSEEKAFVEFSVEAKDYYNFTKRKLNFFELEKKAKGEMQPREQTIVPYYLSGQMTRLNIKLMEKDSTPVKLYIRLYKDGILKQEEEVELGLTNPTIEKPKDIAINVEPGVYIASVEDRSKKVYAQTILNISEIEVEVIPNWQDKKFDVYLYSPGISVNPKLVSISLDSKAKQTFSSSNYKFAEGKTYITYEYPFDLEPKTHTINVIIGNWRKEVPVVFVKPRYFWDDPLVVFLGFLSIVIFAIGFLIKRPEILKYGLDIPDFPPISKIKIPVKRETVIQLFNDINVSYSWKYMPLRLDEIKNGFRRLTYNGKPILISDFNLERVLSKLISEGKVKEELGYYGIVDWEKESNHTIRYLTIYRIMRNVFVNNAVRFSKLDTMQDCDVKAIVGKEELYFHILEDPRQQEDSKNPSVKGVKTIIHKALASAKKGTTIIVFKNEEDKNYFTQRLSSTNKLAIILKMEIETEKIFLLTVKNEISAFLKTIIK